jgi:hypothetical protein
MFSKIINYKLRKDSRQSQLELGVKSVEEHNSCCGFNELTH